MNGGFGVTFVDSLSADYRIVRPDTIFKNAALPHRGSRSMSRWKMQEQLAYLKAIVEGEDDVERWSLWFARNKAALSSRLTRTEFLNLKINRIKAIPSILRRFGVPFTPSERYGWMGGDRGRCRECGAAVIVTGGTIRCPTGCFFLTFSKRRT